MHLRILPKEQLVRVVGALMTDYRVVGPVEKGPQFGFERLNDPLELRLDYNISILPPKTALQPPRERLVSVRLDPGTGGGLRGEPVVEPVVEAVPTLLFGVHTCDLMPFRFLTGPSPLIIQTLTTLNAAGSFDREPGVSEAM
jgi:hypothetical protein